MVGLNKQVFFTTKAEGNPYSQFFARFPKLYEQANSSELWCKHTFSSFIESLTFYRELGLIADEVLNILKNDLHNLLMDAENFANERNKGGGGRFELYLSPLTLANSIFLLDRNDKMTSFLKMYSINSIWTSNLLHDASAATHVAGGPLLLCDRKTADASDSSGSLHDQVAGADEPQNLRPTLSHDARVHPERGQ